MTATAVEATAEGDPQQEIAELRRRLDQCSSELAATTAALDEALAQQQASAEILQVINSSPGDLKPVFDAILEKAHGLCGASIGWLLTFDGEFVHTGVMRGMADLDPSVTSEPFLPGPAMRRLIEGESFVQIPDISEVKDAPGTPLLWRVSCEQLGTGTYLVVPLRKDGTVRGFINAFRSPVRLFSEKEIALLQNFAAQAVIAMENARLLTETRESLEFQTATSEVLQVISRSAFDLDAVLQTVVSTAVQLCRGEYGVIFRNEGGEYRFAAGFGASPEYEEHERQSVIRPGRGTIVGRAALEGRAVQIADALSDPDYEGKEAAAQLNARTMLGVPLLREGQVIGALGLARNRIEAFSAREVELVTTFADQAAIAIENARLLGELRQRTRDLEESLEYQTATSDVLQVISRSTFDLQPVLDTLVETAVRLCGAEFGNIFRRKTGRYRRASSFGLTAEMRQFLTERNYALEVDRGSIVGRVVLEGGVVHVHDAASDPEYKLAESVSLGKLRSCLGVPLLREGDPIGVITLGRHRVEPFTERQIELVRTFADQAVIAIENTRLLTELRESLEQQQAMAEVLGVINANPGNLQPVFDTVLEKAHSLCDSGHGTLFLRDGDYFRPAAMRGVPEPIAERLRDGFLGTDVPVSSPLLAGERFVHILDPAQLDHPMMRVARENGVRTLLSVPLRQGGALLGVIVAARFEAPSFTDKQIALLESFAAQAVIAMDNARLLDEIRQRQAELRVTFDNMGDGVAMFDAELRLAAWNHNFQTLLDLPADFLAGRPRFAEYVGYLAEHGEYGSPDLEADIRRGLDDPGRENRFERTRPDGRVIEVRRNPVPGGGFVLMYGDVTERKRAEEAVRAARDAAEKALAELSATQQQLVVQQKMAALGQLTAGIAHEIKNPLNFVNNFAGLSNELLAELKENAAPALATLDADTRAELDETFEMLSGNLDKIAEHGRRADGIVRSMLEHSRGGSGERRAVDLNALIEESLNLAYHGARAQDQNFNITLERDFDPAVAPIELMPQDVTRVFLNLIGNGFYAATKKTHTADRGFRPILRVATRDLGAAVEVRVRDNGTGIAPEIRDRLFQPFVTTKPTGEGTGLGLSISYDIVAQQHGGTIEVASEEGEFTEFTVRLPRAAVTA
jgi:two-component system, NtrC family, sensor kinase